MVHPATTGHFVRHDAAAVVRHSRRVSCRRLARRRAEYPEDGMIRDALFIVKQDLSYLLHRRETLLWTFVMPIIFFYFIGTVTGGFGGRSDEPDPIAVIVPANAGFLA